MRVLNSIELRHVSGGCDTTTEPGELPIECDVESGKSGKGNNGFGNGSDDPNLAAPGRSGLTPGNKDFSLFR
jgi:hypothetical protein